MPLAFPIIGEETEELEMTSLSKMVHFVNCAIPHVEIPCSAWYSEEELGLASVCYGRLCGLPRGDLTPSEE